MGNTIIQTLMNASQPGLLLFESFESDSWLADEGWTIVQGSPVNSPNQAFDGVKSFIVDSSLPIVSNTFTASQWIVGYFFDDASQNTQTFSPFLKVSNGGTNVGLGIKNPTGFYFYQNNGTPFVTTIARTTGWHRFTFLVSGTNWILSIDGTVVATLNFGLTSFTGITVGYDSGTGTPFGFFDFIQVAPSKFLTLKNLIDGQSFQLFDVNNNQIDATHVSVGGQVIFDISAQDSPFNAYFRGTKADGFTPFFFSDTDTRNAGEIYNLDVLDFGRKANPFSNQPMVKRTDKESASGVVESIWFFSRDVNSLTLTDLTEDQRRLLRKWWGHAQRVEVYSVAIDSDKTIRALLTASAANDATTLQVDNANGIGRGTVLVLKRTDNFLFEYVTVASVAGNILTLKSPILNFYSAQDEVRSEFYWPFCLSNDLSLRLDMINPRAKRWNFSHSFRERL